MKKLKILIIFTFILLIPFLLTQKVNASSLYIEDYKVDVNVNKDSTMDVLETITFVFTGEFHRVNRGITLENEESVKQCKSDSSLQCGGISYASISGVYDSNGDKVSENQITTSEVDNGYDRELQVVWEFAPNGRYFNNEKFIWSIGYKVFGSLGYFDDYDLFYWNVFPPSRDFGIEKAMCSISFPEDIEFKDEDLKVLYSYTSYNFNYDSSNHKLAVTTEKVPVSEDFTILLKYPKGIIDKYATLDLDLSPETQNMWIDGIEILNVNGSFSGLTPGSHKLKFTSSGYIDEEVGVSLKAGEVKNLEVKLEKTPWNKLLVFISIAGNVLSCFGGLTIIVLIFINYQNKGRDIGGRKTIVPWFKPPRGISPVIVGSIKDEKVHLTDITSTIINAAVRGFIKIKEISKKNYKLIKLKEFVASDVQEGNKRIRYDTLDNVEVKILNDIFGEKKEEETDSLKNKFYLKIPNIENEIYTEMEIRGYFARRPDKVRSKHLGIGILILIFGGVLSFITPLVTIITCGPSLIIAGVIKIMFSFFMPAKTSIGTDLYEKCKGFRMFLHTAERFRMQKLTPETFERFLPYAMVFGVEKQWAENFKDIYTKPPDWYEGGRWGTFNTIYFINSISTMGSSVGSVMASSPRSSSSSGWSGGGWSGGGGFSGGFSGGGGGGGSVGAS